MPQELKIDIAGGIVHAVVSGDFSLSNAMQFFREILRVAREENLSRILIDTRDIATDIPASARFDFGTYMSEQQPVSMKIAFVGSRHAVWPDRFLETVAVNRGVNSRVVTDIEEALNWLTE